VLDHVTIPVRDLERSRAFYDAVMPSIGVARLYAAKQRFLGYGTTGKAFFWIGQYDDGAAQGVHVAFACGSRHLVDRFHASALRAGGVDHGAPGLRPHYHDSYYGAFVLDPDGHNIEAVCHAPEVDGPGG
jgi:catechol 2,3-dioxygenase-like lactoylglutathione lyase family enzyme